jgi:hypothetical protein
LLEAPLATQYLQKFLLPELTNLVNEYLRSSSSSSS